MSETAGATGVSARAPPGVGLGDSTVKPSGLLVVEPTWTVTGPLDALSGTAVVIEVSVADLTDASVPLNSTVLSDGVRLKPSPESTTTAPGSPEVGDSDWRAMAGGSCTVKVADAAAAVPC